MICLHLRLILINRQVDLVEFAAGDVPCIDLLAVEALRHDLQDVLVLLSYSYTIIS